MTKQRKTDVIRPSFRGVDGRQTGVIPGKTGVRRASGLPPIPPGAFRPRVGSAEAQFEDGQGLEIRDRLTDIEGEPEQVWCWGDRAHSSTTLAIFSGDGISGL